MRIVSKILRGLSLALIVLAVSTCYDSGNVLQERTITNFSGDYYNETSINSFGELVVSFDKPVFSLSDYDAMVKEIQSKLKLTISPDVPGRWRPVGTQAAAFEFAKRLSYSTHYDATINASEIRSLDGQPVKVMINYQDASRGTYSFETKRITVNDAQAFSQFLDTPVYLYFSSPVDIRSVAQKVTISGGPSGNVPFDASYATYTNSFEISNVIIRTVMTNRYKFILKPRGNLTPATVYTVSVPAGFMGVEGNMGTQNRFADTFHTYYPLKPVRFYSTDRRFYPDSTIVFEWNNTLVTNADPNRMVMVEPSVTDFAVHIYGNNMYVSGNFVGGTTYKFTVIGGVKDIYGQTYNKNIEQKIDFEHSLSYIAMPRGYLVMENYLPLILPFKIRNIGTVDFKYYYVSSLRELAKFLNTSGGYNRNLFDRFSTTKTIKLNWSWDKYYNYRLDLGAISGHKNGVLLYNSVAHLENYENNDTTSMRGMVLFTDLGVSVKSSDYKTVVFVRTLKDNKPVSGAEVYLVTIGNNGGVRLIGKTDSRGIFMSTNADVIGHNPCIGVQHGDSFSINYGYSSSYSYYDDYDYDYGSSTGANTVHWGYDYDLNRPAFTLFTDRYLYNPGETVEFKGIVRYRTHDRWTLNPNNNEDKFTIRVNNSRGEQVTNLNLTADEWGSLHFSLPTSKDAPTGYYSVHASDGTASWYFNFRVEDFKPATAEMKIIVDKSRYVWGDNFTAKVIGWYLFGAPVIKPYSISMNVQPSYYSSRNFPDYSYGVYNWYYDEDRTGHRDNSFTLADRIYFPDQNGEVQLSELLQKDDFWGDGTITLSASTVLDDSSTVFGSRGGIDLVNPVHVGIDIPDYFVDKGKPFTVSVIALNADDQIASGVPATVELEKREWKSYQKAGVNGRLEWYWEMIKTVVEKRSVTLGRQSLTFKLNEPGYYVARVKTVLRGHESVAETTFYVLGPGYFGWKVDNEYEIELESDKQNYEVGETAKILIKNPFVRATALVTLERGDIYEIKQYEISNSLAVIPVTLKEDYIPNIYVSVMLFSGRSGVNNVHDDEDLSRPSYRLGYINLEISKKNKELTVVVKPDRTSYEPGQVVTGTVDVYDYTGRRVESEVTFSAADKGVLNLVGYQLPNPLTTFYADRSLAVWTSEMRNFIFGQRYLSEKGEVVGGDGCMEKAMVNEQTGSIQPRFDFRSTAYFTGKLFTTASGPAKFQFKLPDNLTTFKLMAVAQTRDSRFGYGDSAITVSKPLMLMASLPRFLRIWDVVEAGTVVHNYTGSKQTVTVTIKADRGVQFSGATVTNLILENNGSAEVRFKFKVQNTLAESVQFTVTAKSGSYSDGVQYDIPIRNPKIYETTALYQNTTASANQRVNVTEAVIPELSRIQVTASPTAFAELKGCVDSLIEYPYGCLEQKTSSVLPLILGEDVIVAQKLLKDKTRDDLRQIVQRVLDEVNKYMTGYGFVYWPDSRYECDPYLTVYTTFVLTMAKQKGYFIPQGLYDKAVGWVKAYADGRGYWPSGWWDYSPYYRALVRNFALYVSAMNGYQNVASVKRAFLDLKTLYNDCLTPYAFLLKTVARYRDFDQKQEIVDYISKNFFERSRVEASTVYFEGYNNWGWFYYNNVVSTALVVQALIEANVEFADSFKVINWLIRARKAEAWSTTHENAIVFWAFSTYLNKFEHLEPDFRATIGINNDQVLSAMFRSRTAPTVISNYQLRAGDRGSFDVKINKTGTGTLYYYVRYQYILRNYPAFRDAGYVIEKKFYDYETGAEITDNTFVRGKRYLVKIKITTPKDRTFVVLDDQLPAGFEPVNLDFLTEANERNVRTGESAHGWWWWGNFDHTEQYRDRVIFTADYLRSGSHDIQYVVRATTLGTFQVPQIKAEGMYEPEVFGYRYQPDVKVVERR